LAHHLELEFQTKMFILKFKNIFFIVFLLKLVKSDNNSSTIIDDEKLDVKNESSYTCEELINFVTESDNIHGFLTLKGIDKNENFNITVEFGIPKNESKLNENYHPFIEFVEEDELSSILDINFGFAKPVPKLVSLRQEELMLCEKGNIKIRFFY
jgi:hypothetical protein